MLSLTTSSLGNLLDMANNLSSFSARLMFSLQSVAICRGTAAVGGKPPTRKYNCVYSLSV